jgi:hypothetical protein
MSFDAQRLYDLLPAIYRICDQSQDEPLRALLAVMSEQIAVVEENLDQLYDDQFIETCAEWVVPYIGDLIGYRALHGVVSKIGSPRAEVANTIGYRRRKGTAAMLEQLARDVTGWPARVVEFFELLRTTQYMNHIRLFNAASPSLRDWEALERLDSAFGSTAHTIDVRCIATRKGRFNIPNIGIFLWRIQAFRLQDSPAVKLDAHRFLFSPLGNDSPLFTRPLAEDQIEHLATPLNVPEPISRRVLDAHFDDYYGGGDEKSLVIDDGGSALPVQVCDLSDDGGGAGAWAHKPEHHIAVDPVLGRIAFPDDQHPDTVKVTYHYGFAAEMGGGPYERAGTFAQLTVDQARLRIPGDHATIQAAIDALPPEGGIVEITDNGRYVETLAIKAAAGATIELRAANERRPTVILTDDFSISGGAESYVTLNGLLIVGSDTAAPKLGTVRVATGPDGSLAHLRIRHCTLVPGLRLAIDGKAQNPDVASLSIDMDGVAADIDKSILGGVRVAVGSACTASGSIIDSTAADQVAYAAPDGRAAGGSLTLRECTVVGRIHADRMPLISNSILLAVAATSGDWKVPIRAARRQEGCLRFSFVPLTAIVPRRYRCQPELAVATEIARLENLSHSELSATERDAVRANIEPWLVPGFMALRYGRPDYLLMRESCPSEICTGADDESEMGAFHDLYAPQRETNLRVRLEEYLRFGLEAGIFFA